MSQSPLEDVLQGKKAWTLAEVLGIAKQRLHEQFSTWLKVLVTFIGALALLVLIVMQTVSIDDATALPDGQRVFLNFALILITAPLLGGLSMLGVRSARREKIHFLNMFDYLPQTLTLALAQLTLSLLVQLGLVLFIIPGVFLYMGTSFVLHLMLDQNMRLFDAIRLSVRVVYAYLGKFVMLYVFFIVLFLIAFITFGVGFLWVAPFYYVVMGVIYDRLFVTDVNDVASEHLSTLGRFDA